MTNNNADAGTLNRRQSIAVLGGTVLGLSAVPSAGAGRMDEPPTCGAPRPIKRLQIRSEPDVPRRIYVDAYLREGHNLDEVHFLNLHEKESGNPEPSFEDVRRVSDGRTRASTTYLARAVRGTRLIRAVSKQDCDDWGWDVSQKIKFSIDTDAVSDWGEK